MHCMDCASLKDPADSSTSTKEADWSLLEAPAESLLSTTEPVNPPVKSKGQSKGQKVKSRVFKGLGHHARLSDDGVKEETMSETEFISGMV